MDWQLLRDKVELIIKGLECMDDIQSADEFINHLDDFTKRQINKMLAMKAQADSMKN